ncbi:MAG: YhfC family glutamic-type intramembrane protease, partial [Propioniciclava sp.]
VLIAQVQASAPGQVAALQAQIAALQGLQWTGIVLGIWERILAMTLHVCLALTVLRTVREGRLGWLWLAMVIHAGYNLVALVTVQYAGALVAEAVLTVLTLGAVWALWRGSKARMSGGTTQHSLV